MAWTTSGLFCATFIDILDATRCLMDLSLTTHKVALYDNSATPNFTGAGDTAYTTTNEVAGTGYTAGGLILTGLSPTVTDAGSGVLKYTHDALSWATATITAYGAEWYADANTAGDGVAKALLVGVYFDQAYTATAGTFTVTPSGTGIFTVDMTP